MVAIGKAHSYRWRDRNSIPRICIDISAAVMRIHEGKQFQGGIIASLASSLGFFQG